MKARHSLWLVLLPATWVAVCGFDSCSPPLLQNPGFDIWCGEHQLCGWEVEAGDIERVATWHERDSGVALVGDPVILSQYVDLSQADATCYVFDLVADADDRADLVLELDFYDDGLADYSLPIPADRWQHVHFDLSAPDYYRGVRFRITKTGPGRAALAQIRAERGEPGVDCTAPGPELPRPAGVVCQADDQCRDGFCVEVEMITSAAFSNRSEQVCSGCLEDGDCPAGQACGLVANQEAWMHRACVPAGRRALGEACASAAECQSGLCCAQQCAECCYAEVDCPAGQECAKREASGSANWLIMPWMCAPGEGSRPAGQPCLNDQDCQSGACRGDGPLLVCDPDGRRCTSDADCPLAPWGASCETLGVENGVCS